MPENGQSQSGLSKQQIRAASLASSQNMTKEQLAAKLNGREYGDEMSKDEEREARNHGLVVVFGYSDDNAEFRGAIDDEYPCFGGGEIKLHARGLINGHDKDYCPCQFCGYKPAAAKCATLRAVWCKGPEYSWTYETEIPHATFDIVEDGERFCRGIVFSVADLPTL